MTKFSYAFGLIVLILAACNDSQSPAPNFKGTLTGEVSAMDEFENKMDDLANFRIELEGSDPLLSTLSDSTGHFELTNIPTGTYDLKVSKQGYGDCIAQGIMILGGDLPLYLYPRLYETSTTRIENIKLELDSLSDLYLKGIGSHNFVLTPQTYIFPTVIYFIHTTPQVSSENFLSSGTFIIKSESGSLCKDKLWINSELFPSGTTIYAIAYGSIRYNNSYYDIESNQYRYTGLGTASNVATYKIP
jgi:hypothetical protein